MLYKPLSLSAKCLDNADQRITYTIWKFFPKMTNTGLITHIIMYFTLCFWHFIGTELAVTCMYFFYPSLIIYDSQKLILSPTYNSILYFLGFRFYIRRNISLPSFLHIQSRWRIYSNAMGLNIRNIVFVWTLEKLSDV